MKAENSIHLSEPFRMAQVLALVNVSSQFQSDIYLIKKDIAYNSKCVLGTANLLTGIKEHDIIRVQAEGTDAEKAVAHVAALLENGGVQESGLRTSIT